MKHTLFYNLITNLIRKQKKSYWRISNYILTRNRNDDDGDDDNNNNNNYFLKANLFSYYT